MKKMDHIFFISILLALALLNSCAKKIENKQKFVLKISALTASDLTGGTFVRAVSSSKNQLVALDANNTGEFSQDVWEFQVISYRGPSAFLGQVYCGGIKSVPIKGASTDVSVDISASNCSSQSFATLQADVERTFKYPRGMSISSITPMGGNRMGGNTITIKGTGFYDHASVMIGNQPCQSTPVVVDNQTITCVVPYSLSNGSVNVTVTNLDSVQSKPGTYRYGDAPTFSSISPSAGSINGMTTVTINGTGFFDGVKVFFDGSECVLPVVNSSTQITCTTPAHAAASVTVKIQNADTQFVTTNSAYTYQPAPVVYLVSPSIVYSAGTTLITVSGKNFFPGSRVFVDGIACGGSTVVNMANTSISCMAPVHPVEGLVDVKVVNPDNQFVVFKAATTYHAEPRITSITPADGPSRGGTKLVIRGTSFYPGASIDLGGNKCAYLTVDGPTQISCTTVSLKDTTLTQPVNVTVKNVDLQSWTTPNAMYTYHAAPVITSLSPTRGEYTGVPTTITLTGTGFESTSVITLDGTPCLASSYVNANSMTCDVPAHLIGDVNVVITNIDKQSYIKTNGFKYVDTTAPDMTGIIVDDGINAWSRTQTPLLKWTAAKEDSKASGIDHYELSIYKKGNPDSQIVGWTNVGNVTSSQITLSGSSFEPGRTYYAALKAIDKSGNTSTTLYSDGWYVRSELYVTDGEVRAVYETDSKLYIGGSFTQLAPWSGGGVRVSPSNGSPSWPTISSVSKIQPRVNGVVYTSISDGSGGFFIGGSFSMVGGSEHYNIAHIFSDGSLDAAFVANTNGPVYALVLNGNKLYAGGKFSFVESTARNNLASFETTVGTLTSWNPNVNNTVRALVVSGSLIYAGGDFTYVSGNTYQRNFAAAFDLTNGIVDQLWDPNFNNSVNALATDGTTNSLIYAGGDFTSVIGGLTVRKYLAALDALAGTVDPLWAPVANGKVKSIAINSTNVYIAGEFSSISSTARSKLACVDSITGSVSNWDPQINAAATVRSIAYKSSTIYAAGDFTSVNVSRSSTNKKYLAAFDTNYGDIVSAWNPEPNDVAFSVSTSTANANTFVYVGGQFNSIDGPVARKNLASIDLTTGIVDASWNPNLNGAVNSMDLYSNILYVGGEFTTIGAAASPVSRAYATAFDTTTGLSTSWAPELNNVVNKVIASSNKVYLAGKFTSANASAYQRNYLAATNLTTGAVDTSWNPNCNAEVLTLALGANSLYAGGKFTQCNSSVTRNYLASFNLTTGSLESNWNPNPNNVVNSIALGNNSLYAGGKFTTVNGTKNKSYLASFNLTDATVTAWAPTVNNYVEAIAYSDDGVYAIGAFTYANNKTRAYSAKFEINQGLLDGTWQAYPEFNPDLGGYPNSRKMLYLSHESVYVGGNFMSAGAEGGAGYLAPLDYVTGNWYPGFSE